MSHLTTFLQSLKSLFIFCSDVHNYQTVSFTAAITYSIIIEAINSWNKTQHQFSNLSLKTYSPTKIKVYFLKNALKTINEEIKGSKFN